MRKEYEERIDYAKLVLDFYQGQITPYNEETGQGNENADLIGLEMLDPNVVAAIRYRSENKTLDGFQLKTFDEMTVEEVAGAQHAACHIHRRTARECANLFGQTSRQRDRRAPEQDRAQSEERV